MVLIHSVGGGRILHTSFLKITWKFVGKEASSGTAWHHSSRLQSSVEEGGRRESRVVTGSTTHALSSEPGEGTIRPRTGSAGAMELRLLTYLSPGLPLALFGIVADHLRVFHALG